MHSSASICSIVFLRGPGFDYSKLADKYGAVLVLDCGCWSIISLVSLCFQKWH